jgi:hypothetical protein
MGSINNARDFKFGVERLRTMVKDFLHKVPANGCMDLDEHVEDLQIRFNRSGEDFPPIVRSGAVQGENFSGPRASQVDVTTNMTFAKLYVLTGNYLWTADPYGSGGLDMKVARELIPMVQEELDELNLTIPTSLKMPGEICSGDTLGEKFLINLDYEPIDLLQFKLRVGLEPGARLNLEDKRKLDEEWEYRTTRAFHCLKVRLTCPAFDYIHHFPIATELMRRLKKEMLEYDSEDITADEIHDWKVRMFEIEEYVRETGLIPRGSQGGVA